MLNHEKGNTWKTIESVFNSLEYTTFKAILNAKDYGIPQYGYFAPKGCFTCLALNYGE